MFRLSVLAVIVPIGFIFQLVSSVDVYNISVGSLAGNENIYLSIDSSNGSSKIPKSLMFNPFSDKWNPDFTPQTTGRLSSCADADQLLSFIAGRTKCSLSPLDFLDGNTTCSDSSVVLF